MEKEDISHDPDGAVNCRSASDEERGTEIDRLDV